MQTKINTEKIKLSSIIFLTILLVSLKWILSFYFFDEDITLRIINETSDTTYFPLIKSFSELNFNPSYSDSLNNLKIVSFPALSLFVNSLSFLILGSYSFVILEFVCVTFFILIFFNIFLELNFSKIFSITLSIFFYILPTILQDLVILDFEFINLLSLNFENFYTSRYPRPIISNLFFFSFIYFIIRFYTEKKNYTKYLFFLFILLGITINTFFYHFTIEFILLIIIYILKFKKNFFKETLDNFKNLIYCFIILLVFLLIFQSQIFFSEQDYIERLGSFKIDTDNKKIIYDYLLSFLFGFEFMFLFFLNTILFFINKNKVKSVFYFLFIASIIPTIIFCLFSNKGIDYYHFFTLIVVTGLLFPLVLVANFFHFNLSIFLKKNDFKKLMQLVIILMIAYFNISYFIKFTPNIENKKQDRDSLNQIVNFIDNNIFFKNKDLEIFNYNYKLSVWFILEDYKNFSLIPVSFWTSKNNDTLENELISSTKFLKQNESDFYNLIKNNLANWKFNNNFVYFFFGRKYLANSLYTFNKDLSEYEEIEKQYIKSNNLLISHQVIIPKNEFKRLLNKFNTTNLQINPDIVILDKNNYFKSKELKNNNYCLIFNNIDFKIYINKKLNPKCA
jgi:hypothetical protein